ncbi:MAG TPA: cytochrome c oxidase subunit II [Terriglobales bacterium]|nr:cytochrome c oxidase subunit II [Terriglobales bacterium]
MRKLFVTIVGSLSILSAGCHSGNHDVLNPAGVQAQRIEHLWWVIFWVSLIVFVLVMAFLGTTIKRRNNDELLRLRPALENPGTEHGLKIGVALAVTITVVALFSMLTIAISMGKAMASLQSSNAVTIEVTGHQWWWEIRYPDSNVSNTVVTANEIHVPVGVPIVMNSTSQDVIHSFWAPNIQGKRDLIPGHNTAIWFEANKEGVFRGQCAEFCGHQHAHMAFLLIAESPEKFQAWLQHQREASVQPASPEAKKGQEVFLSSTCVMCHTIRGTDAGSKNGPDLTHLASRGTLAAATIRNTPGYLAGWIADSQHIKPGNHMPPNPLPADDQQALLTYLEELQ